MNLTSLLPDPTPRPGAKARVRAALFAAPVDARPRFARAAAVTVAFALGAACAWLALPRDLSPAETPVVELHAGELLVIVAPRLTRRARVSAPLTVGIVSRTFGVSRQRRRVPVVRIERELDNPRPAKRTAVRPTRSRYAVAGDRERDGELDVAIAMYADIATAGGAYAEDARYALVRLRGDPPSIADYRAHHPAGRYARAVDVAAFDLALARGDHAAAHREADAFLACCADDPRAAHFRRWRAAP